MCMEDMLDYVRDSRRISSKGSLPRTVAQGPDGPRSCRISPRHEGFAKVFSHHHKTEWELAAEAHCPVGIGTPRSGRSWAGNNVLHSHPPCMGLWVGSASSCLMPSTREAGPPAASAQVMGMQQCARSEMPHVGPAQSMMAATLDSFPEAQD